MNSFISLPTPPCPPNGFTQLCTSLFVSLNLSPLLVHSCHLFSKPYANQPLGINKCYITRTHLLISPLYTICNVCKSFERLFFKIVCILQAHFAKPLKHGLPASVKPNAKSVPHKQQHSPYHTMHNLHLSPPSTFVLFRTTMCYNPNTLHFAHSSQPQYCSTIQPLGAAERAPGSYKHLSTSQSPSTSLHTATRPAPARL